MTLFFKVINYNYWDVVTDYSNQLLCTALPVCDEVLLPVCDEVSLPVCDEVLLPVCDEVSLPVCDEVSLPVCDEVLLRQSLTSFTCCLVIGSLTSVGACVVYNSSMLADCYLLQP